MPRKYFYLGYNRRRHLERKRGGKRADSERGIIRASPHSERSEEIDAFMPSRHRHRFDRQFGSRPKRLNPVI
jgi:hypothetical protein